MRSWLDLSRGGCRPLRSSHTPPSEKFVDNIQNRSQLFPTEGQMQKTFPVWHSNTRSQCHQVDPDLTTPCVIGMDYKVALLTRDAISIHKKQYNHRTSVRETLTAPRGTALFHNPYLTVINFEASYRSL